MHVIDFISAEIPRHPRAIMIRSVFRVFQKNCFDFQHDLSFNTKMSNAPTSLFKIPHKTEALNGRELKIKGAYYKEGSNML